MTEEQIIAAIVRCGTARRSLEAIRVIEGEIGELIAVCLTSLIEADRRLQQQLHALRGG